MEVRAEDTGRTAGADIHALRMLVVRDAEAKAASLAETVTQLEKEKSGMTEQINQQAVELQRLSELVNQRVELKAALDESESVREALFKELSGTTLAHAASLNDLDKARAEIESLTAQLQSLNGVDAQLKEQSELVRRLQHEQGMYLAENHELKAENETVSVLINDIATAMEKTSSVIKSHENHNDKTSKLMAAQFAELQRVRRSWNYVSHVNGLLQRDTLYNIPDKADVFLLSTSSLFLGEPYKNTPYCVYMLLDMSGKGHVIFEHEGKLMTQSGGRLPLTAEQKAEVLGRIKETTQQQFKDYLNEGLSLSAQLSNSALASEQSQKDIKELGEHFMSEPENKELVAAFTEIMRRYANYKREHAARQKQQKKSGRGKP